MPKKNTKGGKGFKSFARKNISYLSNTVFPSNELEKIGRVVKFFGNMCQIITQDADGIIYNCHIRGKFKGRSKRSCIISVGKYVLVGFRHFETPVFKNCDLLEVYDETTDLPILISTYDLSSLNHFLPGSLISYANDYINDNINDNLNDNLNDNIHDNIYDNSFQIIFNNDIISFHEI